ncbi:GNAT family N-acetyltransferase, partial [Variovorax sp. J22R203]|uniref:GNAT family N-acetyltransferase n=1 Tax=Variovorax sp. J22R203 TaxID=3053512 RepID=UPI002576321A
VDRVERLYREDGAPAVFRIGDAGNPVGLGADLDARGYAVAAVTDVLALYLTAADTAGTDVAVLRAAPVDDWVALSCLQVAPAARRRGVGRALTRQALALAADGGARRAFLQVEAENTAALRLYAALGFRPAHRYAYRVQPGHGGGTGC